MPDQDDPWMQEMLSALSVGEQLIRNADEVNTVCDHIASLLSSSGLLLSGGDAPRAAFLAITAIEETAKANVGMWRGPGEPIARRDDALYSHKKKHELGAAPTVAMGARLAEAVGADRVTELMQQARSGALVKLREKCLYFSSSQDSVSVPADFVDREAARSLLLFAIEAFDDTLVGYTNQSFTTSDRMTALFLDVAHNPAL